MTTTLSSQSESPYMAVQFQPSYRQVTVGIDAHLTSGDAGLPPKMIPHAWGANSGSLHDATITIFLDGHPKNRVSLPGGPQDAKLSITLLSVSRGWHQVTAALSLEGADVSGDSQCVLVK